MGAVLADPDGDRKIGLRQFFKLFQVRRCMGMSGLCDGARLSPGSHLNSCRMQLEAYRYDDVLFGTI